MPAEKGKDGNRSVQLAGDSSNPHCTRSQLQLRLPLLAERLRLDHHMCADLTGKKQAPSYARRLQSETMNHLLAHMGKV